MKDFSLKLELMSLGLRAKKNRLRTSEYTKTWIYALNGFVDDRGGGKGTEYCQPYPLIKHKSAMLWVPLIKANRKRLNTKPYAV